jgi:nucleoside-diphosphate-sugar epimerase
MSRILITGTSGYIASGFTGVTTLSLRENISATALSEIDVVIHLAGLAHKFFTEEQYDDINIKLSLELARKSFEAGVKRFVYLSTVNVGDTLEGTVGLAAKSKWHTEKGLEKIANETGLELVIIRAPLVYSRNAPGNFGLLEKLIKKLPFLPFGLVKNKRCFIARLNLVDLLLVCSKHQYAASHIFYASDSCSVSTKEFTNAISKGMNKKILQIPIPIFLIKILFRFVGKQNLAEQLFDDLVVDISNLKNILNWTPPYTMEEAMAYLPKQDN